MIVCSFQLAYIFFPATQRHFNETLLMYKKLISIYKFLLILAVAFVLLYFAFRGISIKKVFSEILKAKIFWVLLSLLFSIIAIVSRAYRWNLLIEPLGYSPKLKNTTYAVSIGYFANL